ncbi:MAG: hypothetical protein Q9221_007685 [Calogaya cf. arnoldii]
MSTPALETLSPEVQAQIMRNISSVPALISLLRASPRFYQVFRNRKEYLLTQLAFNQFHPGIIDDVWTLAKACQVPQPVPPGGIHNFISDLALVDTEHEQHSIPTSIIAPLCKIGPTIEWFAEDYRQSSLRLLADVGTQMEIKQDYDVLHLEYGITEKGRVQRALCRFEILCHLKYSATFREERKFMLQYLADDVEEIACIRDYLVRRLCGVFEAIEERAVQGNQDSAIRKLGKACQRVDWFSGSAKLKYPGFMEYIMSKGLRFVREVLESDSLRRAELVMTHSFCRNYFISHAVSDETGKFADQISLDFNGGSYDGEGDYVGDDLDALSQGLLWANHSRIPSDWERWPLKGLRDWGYLFWSRRRLEASGVLDLEPEDVAVYLFNDREDRRSVEDRLFRYSETDEPELFRAWRDQSPLVFERQPEGRRRSSIDTYCLLEDGEPF